MDTSGNVTTDIINSLLYFYNSPTFSVIKFIIGIYVAVIVVDIILLLYQRGVAGDIRETRLGMNVPKEFFRKKPKEKLVWRWNKLKKEIESDEEARIKKAIIEADDIIDDLIARMGYPGANMGERIENITPGQIENISDIKEAHLVRNRIIHDESFSPNREQALEALKPYEEFLRFHRVFD